MDGSTFRWLHLRAAPCQLAVAAAAVAALPLNTELDTDSSRPTRTVLSLSAGRCLAAAEGGRRLHQARQRQRILRGPRYNPPVVLLRPRPHPLPRLQVLARSRSPRAGCSPTFDRILRWLTWHSTLVASAQKPTAQPCDALQTCCNRVASWWAV